MKLFPSRVLHIEVVESIRAEHASDMFVRRLWNLQNWSICTDMVQICCTYNAALQKLIADFSKELSGVGDVPCHPYREGNELS